MSIPVPTLPEALLYPDSDGKPMADNTIQFRYITTIKLGLDGLLSEGNVFVAGDLLWYPVRGQAISVAPDVLVAFGRPKGDRGSYRQWEEAGIAPQVVFEILSPNNTDLEMREKLVFYDTYGVEEYYQYDPEIGELLGWERRGRHLAPIRRMDGWVSPRLGVRFQLEGKALRLYDPSGEVFTESDHLVEERNRERQRAEEAERAAAEERLRAEHERLRADRLCAWLKQMGLPEPPDDLP